MKRATASIKFSKPLFEARTECRMRPASIALAHFILRGLPFLDPPLLDVESRVFDLQLRTFGRSEPSTSLEAALREQDAPSPL